MGEKICLADKETLDKTKNNTDKIMQDTTYLRNLSFNNKNPLRLERIINESDFSSLENRLNKKSYSISTNRDYFNRLNVTIKDYKDQIIKTYNDMNLYGTPYPELIFIGELDLLIVLMGSSSTGISSQYMGIFNMKNWKFTQTSLGDYHPEIVGFDWISNRIIVKDGIYLIVITINDINELKISRDIVKNNLSKSDKQTPCILYKKDDIAYFLHYNSESSRDIVVSEYDSSLMPNGIMDIYNNTINEKNKYVIKNRVDYDEGFFYKFIIKPIEYNNFIIFQHKLIVIDTKEKKAMFGYGLDFSNKRLLEDSEYYLIYYENKAFILTSIEKNLMIMEINKNLKGGFKRMLKLDFLINDADDKNYLLNNAQYMEGKLYFNYFHNPKNSSSYSYITESINIKELLDGSEF